LNNKLSNAQTLLPGLVANREKLEDRLTQAESSLDKSQAKFSQSVKSIEYGEDLFEIADDCNVDLTSLSPSTPTSIKLGAVTYSVSSFAMVVQGNVDNILDFIYAIRTGEDFQLPWSADLKGVNMDGSQAAITLDIYSYKG